MRSLSRSSLVAVVAGSAAVVACGAGAWADPLPGDEWVDSPQPVQESASPVAPQPWSEPSETEASPIPADTPSSQPVPAVPVESSTPSADPSTPTSPAEEPQPATPSQTTAPVTPVSAPTTQPSETPSEEAHPTSPSGSEAPSPEPTPDITGAIADSQPDTSGNPVIPDPAEPSIAQGDEQPIPAPTEPTESAPVSPAPTENPPVDSTVEPVAPIPTIETAQNDPVQPVSPAPVSPQPEPPIAQEQAISPNTSLPVPAPSVPRTTAETQQPVAPRFGIQSPVPNQIAPATANPAPSSESLAQSAQIVEQANRPLMTFGVQSKPNVQNEDARQSTGSSLGSVLRGQGGVQEGGIPGAAEWVSSYLNATEPKERGRLTAGSNFGVNGAKDTQSVAGGTNTYGNVMRGESLISGPLPLAAFSALAITSIAVIIRIFITTNRKS